MDYDDGIEWYQCDDREEIIRRYLEVKGCPYLISTDGGTYTRKANEEDRSAMAAVLWAPYMSLTESFEDILHCWQDRPAIPLGARVGILPKQIGTEEVNCGHNEIEALISGCERSTPHDLCLYEVRSGLNGEGFSTVWFTQGSHSELKYSFETPNNDNMLSQNQDKSIAIAINVPFVSLLLLEP